MPVRIYDLGESALVLAHEAPATFAVQRRMWAVAARARTWSGIADVVVGMNNVTLFLERAESPAFRERLRDAWDDAEAAEITERHHDIQVEYGGEAGPDLDDVARRCGVSVTDVIAMHSQAHYVVYFVGFQPGFAYLGGLDARLQLPRRAEPRAAVPAGSVAIAGEQAGIYPVRAPGGWHLIGRTDAQLFDPARTPAALLAPGDSVRFVPRENGACAS